MRRAGLVGGLGPESTIDYYHRITALCPSAEIIINSLVVDRMVGFITNDRAAAADYLVRAVEQLAAAGADFAAVAANTPHIVFDRVRPRAPIPLVSIVDATLAEVRKRGLERPGVFGTRFTIQSRLYVDAIAPNATEQDFIHDKYMNELLKGMFLPETRARMLAIADRLIDEHRIDSLILGGTELPLLLREESHRGIPLLDTTAIHVNAIVEAIHSDGAI